MKFKSKLGDKIFQVFLIVSAAVTTIIEALWKPVVTILCILGIYFLGSSIANATPGNQDITEFNTGFQVCEAKIYVEQDGHFYFKKESFASIMAYRDSFEMAVDTSILVSGKLTYNGIDYPYSKRGKTEYRRIMTDKTIEYVVMPYSGQVRYYIEAICPRNFPKEIDKKVLH